MTLRAVPALLAVALSGSLSLAEDAAMPSPGPETETTGQPVGQPAPKLPDADQEALDLGRKVLAVKRAIANPGAPAAMPSVTNLGHDSRYYVMVRGWLKQQLSADQSIADARGKDTPKKIRDRISFLTKAIRAIDLE
ncbi:MAG: hypothetical protein K9N23_20730 [Akkermansiaceae bacterium]|nr:hypothetical protein [Akkermansiaceae bacterium]